MQRLRLVCRQQPAEQVWLTLLCRLSPGALALFKRSYTCLLDAADVLSRADQCHCCRVAASEWVQCRHGLADCFRAVAGVPVTLAMCLLSWHHSVRLMHALTMPVDGPAPF